MSKYEQMQRECADKFRGVLIDSKWGRIYRLDVSPSEKYRVAENRFSAKENTVIGPAINCYDFDDISNAIALMERISRRSNVYLRDDDRVMWVS